MEKCPGCGRFTMDDFNNHYKRCYTTGCAYYLYRDGSVSFLRFDPDKIRRVRKYLNGAEEIVTEFGYPKMNTGVNSKKLRPGYPPFLKKVRLLADIRIKPRSGQTSEKIIISDTGVSRIRNADYPSYINSIIPAGTLGIIDDEPFSGLSINCNLECPILFFCVGLVGVPWNILELAD